MSGRFFLAFKMTPSKSEFMGLARGANVVPVYAELLADTETPVSAFAKFGGSGECFLLESAENVDNWGRYSFIGCNPTAVFNILSNEADGIKNDEFKRKNTGIVCRMTHNDGMK